MYNSILAILESTDLTNKELGMREKAFKLGQKLKSLREEKGISQAAFGKLINIPQSKVSRWELGSAIPDIFEALIIADYYKISVRKIFDPKQFAPEENVPKRVLDEKEKEIEELRKQLESKQQSLDDVLRNLPSHRDIEALMNIQKKMEAQEEETKKLKEALEKMGKK